MSPGGMPGWPRPARARSMIAYRRRRARLPERSIFREVSFGTTELPVASVHSARGALHRWADLRWAWVRPRAVPALVALMALVGLLAVTKHLPRLAEPNEPIVATAPVIDVSTR
jgi:hypothetical protein